MGFADDDSDYKVTGYQDGKSKSAILRRQVRELEAKLEKKNAECREREKAAALSMAEWVLERYMDQKSIGSWEIEAEASHRYGEGRRKA